MTASRLLASIASWGLALSVGNDGKLVVTGRPSRSVQLLIGLYREPLLSVLMGCDVALSETHPADQLAALGFVAWKDPEGRISWVHDLGDEHGYRILCGDISFESAQAEHAEQVRRAYRIAASEGLTVNVSRRHR